MHKYKVTGDKLISYYMDVEANDPDEAWDIAAAAGSHEWLEIESDNTIEVYNVEVIDHLEDGWPVIKNEILVTGSSVDESDISD
jgi:hypothetical protein